MTLWELLFLNYIFSSFDEGNNDDDLLSQHLDVVLDISDAPCGLSDDSDECSI